MFTEITIKGEVYKLRLRTVDVIQLEKRLNKNLMDMFMSIQNDKLPQLRDMLIVLHGAMAAYNHGITESKFYELYDEWLEEGHSMFELVPIVMELMQKGGLVPSMEDNN